MQTWLIKRKQNLYLQTTTTSDQINPRRKQKFDLMKIPLENESAKAAKICPLRIVYSFCQWTSARGYKSVLRLSCFRRVDFFVVLSMYRFTINFYGVSAKLFVCAKHSITVRMRRPKAKEVTGNWQWNVILHSVYTLSCHLLRARMYRKIGRPAIF